MFSFSSDAESDVERSTSGSGRRGTLAVVATGGDLAPGRPSPTEDVDDTRVDTTPVGDIVVESDARCRISTARAGSTVKGVGILLDAVLGGVVEVVLIRTLLPSAATRAVVENSSEVFSAFGASLLASERREAGRVFDGERVAVVDSRRI